MSRSVRYLLRKMKLSLATISVTVGITVLLIDVFFEEYMFGLNTPILLLALGMVLVAFVELMRHEKKNK